MLIKASQNCTPGRIFTIINITVNGPYALRPVPHAPDLRYGTPLRFACTLHPMPHAPCFVSRSSSRAVALAKVLWRRLAPCSRPSVRDSASLRLRPALPTFGTGLRFASPAPCTPFTPFRSPASLTPFMPFMPFMPSTPLCHYATKSFLACTLPAKNIAGSESAAKIANAVESPV